MIAFVSYELRRYKRSLIAYCVVVSGFTWMYIAMFPTVEKQSKEYAKLLSGLPKGLMEVFGFDASGFTTIEKFLASEMMSLIWPILAILLIVSQAGASIAGSIENRTLGLELSLPITRYKIYFAKLISRCITASIFSFISIGVIIPITRIYSIDIDYKNLLLTFVLCLVFGFAMASFSLAISAFSSEKGSLYMIVGAVLILSYVVNVVASLAPSFSWLNKFSLFHYFSAAQALGRGQIEATGFIFFILVLVISTIVGAIEFSRRDISI